MRLRWITAAVLLALCGCGGGSRYFVSSEPQGATILVDGVAMGKTPTKVMLEFPENRQMVREKKILTLRKEGYRELRELISYQEEAAEKNLHFDLAADPNARPTAATPAK